MLTGCLSSSSLYAALADQLNLHGHKGLTYQDTRKTTSAFMKSHADDFMPFISDSDEHMAGIENTEAGSPDNRDMSKQQRKPPFSKIRRVEVADLAASSCRALFKVLRCRRVDWSLGRTARDTGNVSSFPDAHPCRPGWLTRCQGW